MTDEEFESLIEEAVGKLPAWVREKIKNVAILAEDEPSADVRAAEGLSENETLLGYYRGIPLTARGDMYGVGMTLPDTITIYKEPTLDLADEECPPEATDEEFRGHVRRIVADTVWHEFAHYFGMDEHEVRTREQERGVDHGHPSASSDAQ